MSRLFADHSSAGPASAARGGTMRTLKFRALPFIMAAAGFLNQAASAQSVAQTSLVANTALLKEGVEVRLRFVEPISSKTAALDDPVTLELAEDIRVGDVIVARAGSKAFATVSNVRK